ncbi:MAG: CehA/McbA family metallohydrolase [Candidatus Bathyarchaeota archaeon]
MLKIKIDTHIHTIFSGDSLITVKDALYISKIKGLDCICVTDHDIVKVTEKFNRESSKNDVIIIPGIEVTTEEGHLVGLGVTRPVKTKLSAAETAEKIREAGGLVVIPHPENPFKHSLKLNKDILSEVKPNAIEALTIVQTLLKPNLNKLIKTFNIPLIAGSDSHIPHTVGSIYTIVEVEEKNVEGVLNAIKQGKTFPIVNLNPLLNLQFFVKLWFKFLNKVANIKVIGDNIGKFQSISICSRSISRVSLPSTLAIASSISSKSINFNHSPKILSKLWFFSSSFPGTKTWNTFINLSPSQPLR